MERYTEFVIYLFFLFLGTFLGSRKILPERVWHYLVRILIWFVYPGLLFHSITKAYTRDSLLEHMILPVAGFGIMTVGFAFAHLAFYFLPHLTGQKRGTAGALMTMGNYIFLPFPIAKLLWGDSAGFAVLLASLGSDLGVWTIGVSFFRRKTFSFGQVLNPPLVALFLAILVVYNRIPMAKDIITIKTIYGTVGQLTVPIAMLYLGYQLGITRKPMAHSQTLMPVIIIQLLLTPLVVWGVALTFNMPLEMFRVLMLISSMPSAIASVMLAKLYGGDASLAASGVLATHLVAIITSPLILFLALS